MNVGCKVCLQPQEALLRFTRRRFRGLTRDEPFTKKSYDIGSQIIASGFQTIDLGVRTLNYKKDSPFLSLEFIQMAQDPLHVTRSDHRFLSPHYGARVVSPLTYTK